LHDDKFKLLFLLALFLKIFIRTVNYKTMFTLLKF